MGAEEYGVPGQTDSMCVSILIHLWPVWRIQSARSAGFTNRGAVPNLQLGAPFEPLRLIHTHIHFYATNIHPQKGSGAKNVYLIYFRAEGPEIFGSRQPFLGMFALTTF